MSAKLKPFAKTPKKIEAPAEVPPPAATEAFLEQSAMVSRDPRVRDPGQRAAGGAPAEDENSIYRTVNVKLNKRRYINFKMLSTLTDKSMQDYLGEAVDELIERHQHLLRNLKP